MFIVTEYAALSWNGISSVPAEVGTAFKTITWHLRLVFFFFFRHVCKGNFHHIDIDSGCSQCVCIAVSFLCKDGTPKNALSTSTPFPYKGTELFNFDNLKSKWDDYCNRLESVILLKVCKISAVQIIEEIFINYQRTLINKQKK